MGTPDFSMFTKNGNRIVYKFCQEAIKNKYTWSRICDELNYLERHPGAEECTDTAVREEIYEYCSKFYKIEDDDDEEDDL